MSTTIDDTPAPPLATLVAETIAPPAGIRALASELLRSPVTVAGLVVIVVLLIIAIAGPHSRRRTRWRRASCTAAHHPPRHTGSAPIATVGIRSPAC